MNHRGGFARKKVVCVCFMLARVFGPCLCFASVGGECCAVCSVCLNTCSIVPEVCVVVVIVVGPRTQEHPLPKL